MLERVLTIPNVLGLHARASAQLVRLAEGFESSITLKRCDTGDSVNAKSILGLLGLAAGFGVKIEVIVDGADESEAMDEIVKLILDGFGEM